MSQHRISSAEVRASPLANKVTSWPWRIKNCYFSLIPP
jgi:hypothetical protein